MTAGERDRPGAWAATLRARVLDELERLATVEHALVVEYLSVFCALGHDLEADPAAGQAAERAHEAAGAAFNLAVGEMFHLSGINRGLVLAGRRPNLGRASSIAGEAGAEVPLGPPVPARLAPLGERERAIAAAVDARFARLLPAEWPPGLFDPALLAKLHTIGATGTGHAETLEGSGFLDHTGPGATGLVRVTGGEATDPLGRTLLGLSDQLYALLLTHLGALFAHEELSGFQKHNLPTMNWLNDVNRLLVERGLLPRFTPPTPAGGPDGST